MPAAQVAAKSELELSDQRPAAALVMNLQTEIFIFFMSHLLYNSTDVFTSSRLLKSSMAYKANKAIRVNACLRVVLHSFGNSLYNKGCLKKEAVTNDENTQAGTN